MSNFDGPNVFCGQDLWTAWTGTEQENGHHPQQFSLQNTILLIAIRITCVAYALKCWQAYIITYNVH